MPGIDNGGGPVGAVGLKPGNGIRTQARTVQTKPVAGAGNHAGHRAFKRSVIGSRQLVSVPSSITISTRLARRRPDPDVGVSWTGQLDASRQASLRG